MKLSVYILVFLLLASMVSALGASISTYDPIPAEAGKYVNVWFKIETASDDLEGEYFIEVVPKDGLELSSGEEAKKRIGLLKSYNYDTVEYRFFVSEDAVEGPNTLTVLVTRAGQEFVFEKDLSIQVTEKDKDHVELGVGLIESEPQEIKPDDDNVKLVVTLQNLGDASAKGVTVDLIDLPEGFTLSRSYSGKSLVGNIEDNNQAEATFYVDVDRSVKPGTYDAKLDVTYKYKPLNDEDDFVFSKERISLALQVQPTPLYEIVDIKYEPEQITAGDNPVYITISVKNVGEEKGESVRIKAYGKTEQPFSFEDSSDYLAPSLKPGEIGQGTLELKIEDDAQLKQYYIDLEIKNLVNNDIITYQEKIPLVIAQEKINNPWTLIKYALVAIIVIAFVIISRNVRTKKKRKMHRFKRVR